MKSIDTNNLNDDIGYLIWRISKNWQKLKNNFLVEFGLTGPQLEILTAIAYYSNKSNDVTQVLLSTMLNVDPMTTSIILRKLQKKKLIKREESTIDTRVRLVKLTDAGNEIRQRALEKIKSQNAYLFASLDQDELRHNLQLLLGVLDDTLNKKIK